MSISTSRGSMIKIAPMALRAFHGVSMVDVLRSTFAYPMGVIMTKDRAYVIPRSFVCDKTVFPKLVKAVNEAYYARDTSTVTAYFYHAGTMKDIRVKDLMMLAAEDERAVQNALIF